jgi:hypothetical protein
MYRATLTGIKATDTEYPIGEHVDAGTWEAFGKTPQRAKQLLVDALEKRLAGAKSHLQIAGDKLKQAEALKVPT